VVWVAQFLLEFHIWKTSLTCKYDVYCCGLCSTGTSYWWRVRCLTLTRHRHIYLHLITYIFSNYYFCLHVCQYRFWCLNLCHCFIDCVWSRTLFVLFIEFQNTWDMLCRKISDLKGPDSPFPQLINLTILQTLWVNFLDYLYK
jgi:hypothetical protein